jgi:hypothetical protein
MTILYEIPEIIRELEKHKNIHNTRLINQIEMAQLLNKCIFVIHEK